jgi:signal peptidase II
MGLVAQEGAALVQLLLAGVFVLALDQGIKTIVLHRVQGRQQAGPVGRLIPQVRLCMNRSMGFGLVRDRRALFFLWCFAAVGTILLIHYAPRFQMWAPQIGMGAALGGATSNLLDWVRRGAVTDFIDLHVWPVFNIADAFIVLGVGVALWSTQ